MPDFVDTILLPALFSVLAALVPIVAGVLIAALRKWAEKQKIEWLRHTMAEAAVAAERAVEMVNQTYADHVRDSDGNLDPARAQEALTRALISAKVQLGSDGMAAVTKALGGSDAADSALETFVEAAVRKSRPAHRSSADFVAPAQ